MTQDTTKIQISQLEAKLNDLMSKVQVLERYNTGDLAQNIQNFNIELQKNILTQLKDIRSLLQQAQTEHLTLVQELRKTQEERDKLKKENAKLNYRIVHLLRALEEAESKNSSK
jgi:chromosome segregation ATPase